MNRPYSPEGESGRGSVKPVDVHGTVRATWKGKIWDTFDLPPAERKLLFKVDALLLTFASLGYFIK
jgi:hypothetical protein